MDRANNLIGSTVKGSDGKTLGKVHDIVLTPDHREVSYIALSRGGLFGIGEKLYAVPWSAVQTGVGGKLYVPITKEQLLMKPAFKSAYWPANAENEGWVSRTTGMPGGSVAYVAPTRAESRDVQLRRVTKLIGANVNDASGKKAGDIRDFIIQQDNGQVTYDIVSLGGFWRMGSKYSAVPADAIRFEPGRRVAMINVDRNTLQANAFPPTEWPDLTSPSYAQRVDRLYGVQPTGTALGYVPPQPRSNTAVQSPAAPAPGAASLQTINGTVIDTMDLAGREAGLQGLGIHLRTDQGNTVLVQLAPRDYLSSHNLTLANGDRLTVIGKPMMVGGESIFQAKRIEKDGQVLALRDDNGQPLWSRSSSKPTDPVSDQMNTSSSGQMNQSYDQTNQYPSGQMNQVPSNQGVTPDESQSASTGNPSAGMSQQPVGQGSTQPSGAM